MTERYRQLMFGPDVRAVQEAIGVAFRDAPEAPDPDRLTESEMGFIGARDSFYMATTGADGWPYIQHRGGPKGFVRILSDRSFGFADFRGNRQYLSLGHLRADDRAAFFFMDYVNRARLKLLGRVRVLTADQDNGLIESLTVPGYKARVERALVVEVDAFDWNCPQHITQRLTVEEIAPALAPLHGRIEELEAEIAALRGSVPGI
jgi:uncharacterized protein